LFIFAVLELELRALCLLDRQLYHLSHSFKSIGVITLQVEYPLSEILGARNIAEFRILSEFRVFIYIYIYIIRDILEKGPKLKHYTVVSVFQMGIVFCCWVEMEETVA
jgi:hypothetical protein